MTILHVYSNRHIADQSKSITKGDWIYLENALSLDLWRFWFIDNGIDEDMLNITYITHEEYFELRKNIIDQIIGNPPYTKGNEKLYTRFTEKALDICDNVTFVMPVDLESNHVTLQAHNKRVKTHLKELSENISHWFPNVSQDNIHKVVLDKNIVNNIEEYKNPLDNYELIFKDRKRIKVIKGSNNIETADEVLVGKQAVSRVLKGNNIVYKTVDTKVAEKFNKSKKLNSEWIVFVNHTPSRGLFNCAYIKNDNNPWSMNVIAIEAESEDSAQKLQKWLTSEIIQNEINKMFELKNVYTVSKEILENLPWYE
jgi:hypothetical protein